LLAQGDTPWRTPSWPPGGGVDATMDLTQRLAQKLDEMAGDRTEKITVRLTAAERQQLEMRCQGLAISTYIRSGLFDYPMPRPRTIVPIVNRRLYVELNRIGVNLNQQTKVMNALRSDEITGAVQDYCQTLEALQQQMNQLKVLLIVGAEISDESVIEAGQD
jgi:hypothetical protein